MTTPTMLCGNAIGSHLELDPVGNLESPRATGMLAF
jgi:hypothetical protein